MIDDIKQNFLKTHGAWELRLNGDITRALKDASQYKSGETPDFVFASRWSANHVCVSRVENGVTRSTAHYRQGTLSTWTSWDENGVCTEARRLVFGAPVQMGNWFCHLQDRQKSDNLSLFSPG